MRIGSSVCERTEQTSVAGDLEARAALLLHEDARASRETRNAARCEAQRDQMQKLRQGAALLRRMAESTVASGVLQALCSFASIGEGKLGQAARVLSSLDVFRWEGAYQQADKADLDADAQVAASRGEDCGAAEQDARRVQASATEGLQRLVDGKHRVAMAGQRA